MAEVSTWPTFKAALVVRLLESLPENELGLWWPGDATEGKGIYLSTVSGTAEIALVQGGRKPRNENYTVEFVAQSPTVGPNKRDLTTADEAVNAYVGVIDGILAVDPSLARTVIQAHLSRFAVDVHEFAHGRGVAVRATGAIDVFARLT